MCEFKIIKKNDNSQILEDIVVLSYTEDNKLLFQDVMGVGEILESALILDVNTLNQTCTVYEHDLIRPFIQMLNKFTNGEIQKSDIESLELKLEQIKKKL
jgi:hypothetical protein